MARKRKAPKACVQVWFTRAKYEQYFSRAGTVHELLELTNDALRKVYEDGKFHENESAALAAFAHCLGWYHHQAKVLLAKATEGSQESILTYMWENEETQLLGTEERHEVSQQVRTRTDGVTEGVDG